jgi:hypothetical protein
MLDLATEFLKALANWAIQGFELGLIVGAGYLVIKGVAAIASTVKKALVKEE